MILYWNDEQETRARQAAFDENREAVLFGRRDAGGVKNGSGGGTFESTWLSRVAEVVLADHLGAPWVGYVPNADLSEFMPDIAPDIDVKRAMKHPNLNLHAESKCPDDARLVLSMTDPDEQSVTFFGWIYVKGAKDDAYWKPNAKYGACWTVPADHLAPMISLEV